MRYKVTKDQLERIVENFVMEASIESKKAPVKNMIPSQAAAAKKHVKNKMSGDMVDQSEGMPSVTPMKKKLSQASDAKKHVSKMKAKHSNKATVVKESELLKEYDNASIVDPLCTSIGLFTGAPTVSVDGQTMSKCLAALIGLATIAGVLIPSLRLKYKENKARKDQEKRYKEKNVSHMEGQSPEDLVQQNGDKIKDTLNKVMQGLEANDPKMIEKVKSLVQKAKSMDPEILKAGAETVVSEIGD